MGRRAMGAAAVAAAASAWIIQVLLIAMPATAQQTPIHAAGYCSMYDICGQRSDGKPVNCANATRAVTPDKLFSDQIQSLCPTITGDVCCTVEQFQTLKSQIQQAVPFVVGCPACLRNFLNLFCEMSCSPNQSLFINVSSSTAGANNSKLVSGLEFYVTEAYGTSLYNSCKDVQFGSLNTPAMDFIGGGAKNYTEWFAFLGQEAPLGQPGAVYTITFETEISNPSGMEPLNTTVYSCADSELGCSCGDCPYSLSCAKQSAPSESNAQSTCTVKMGSLKAKCLDFSLVVVYLVLLAAFLLWGLLYRKRAVSAATAGTIQNIPKQSGTTGSAGQSVESSEGASVVGPRVHKPIVQVYMSRFFRVYGVFVARHPQLVLYVSLAIPLLLCIGLIRFRVETNPDKLWVGPGSKAAAQKQYFDTHLAPFYRVEQIIISTTSSEPIVNDQNLLLMFDIQSKIDGLSANYSGSSVTLSDICLKPLGTVCATQSILQYFQMSQNNYSSKTGGDHVAYCYQHYSSDLSCLSAFESPIDPSVIVGGFSGNNYTEASAFVVTYPVINHVETTGNENDEAIAWERAFVNLLKDVVTPMVKAQGLTIGFSSQISIQDELNRESYADAITILISYIVMFAYISFTLGDYPTNPLLIFVSSKVLLGLAGVILVLISVLGSMGFFSAIGMKSTLIIMEVIPFLVLAVGVDNMCILVHAVKRQPTQLDLEERISNALVEVGPSITLASLSEVIAFALSAITPMPATRVFSLFAALAIFLDFILQITAFVALIIFDFRRSKDKRVDCVPCIKLKSNQSNGSGSGKRSVHLLVRYMSDVHAPILAYRAVKIVVVAAFVGFTFASISLLTKIQPGLEQKIVLPRDSYLQAYFTDLADYLRVGPPVYFVVEDFNYSSSAPDTNNICGISNCNPNSLVNEITRASLAPDISYIAKPASSWLDDFLVWLSPEAFGCCRTFVNGSFCPPDDQSPCCEFSSDTDTCASTGICNNCTTCFIASELNNGRPSTQQFRDKLPWFLSALPSTDCAKAGKAAYSTSVDLAGYGNGLIQASSFLSYHTPLNTQSEYINAMKAAIDFSTKITKSLQLQIFPYSVYYIYFEQYLNIWNTAAMNVGVGLGAVFIVCVLITGSLWASLIILLVLAMIILDMLGVMGILGIQLNALSVVNLVMSIGIAVEFCIHITHGFTVSVGDRELRVKQALSTMGASVFSGITLTKLVGVIVLRFAKSEVFVVYYFSMFLSLVLIGFLHGLVFLPVVLSLIGPPSREVQPWPEDHPADHPPSEQS